MNGDLLVALPKGRLHGPVLELLQRSGVSPRPDTNGSRGLLLRDAPAGRAFIPLKPVDIPVYVESGAVHAGIAGTDVLRETGVSVYEPLELPVGRCTMVLAGPPGTDPAGFHPLRVATKYPGTTARFFADRRMHVEIVRLEGSVEIAPLLGLAHVIVDLVESGRTLRENGLVVLDEVAPVSARLIVNRTAMNTRAREVRNLLAQLGGDAHADL
jgi:ATP phosphoribosyltransferase